MKTSRGSPRHRRRRTDPRRRAQLLAAFDRGGLSAAAFARQHGLHYTIPRLRDGWRHRQAKARPVPAFVQVELPTRPAPVELLIELGRSARLRINSPAQIELAAALLHRFNASPAC
jgi:transposase-like protein